MNRRNFVKKSASFYAASILTAYGIAGCSARTKDGKPLNILILTADDMNWDTPGCFGSKVPAITTNLDNFALESMRFTNAHNVIAVCQPSRSAILCGMYPHRSGSMGFERIREGIPTLPDTFKAAGYITGAVGKVHHMRGKESTKYDLELDFNDCRYGRDPEFYYETCDTFFKKCKKEKKPFFFAANSHDPHRPFYGSEQEANHRRIGKNLDVTAKPSRVYTPEEVEVPGFLPDLPDIRQELAEYYSSSRRCDDTMGAVLRALKENGLYDNTMVIFLSDNGISMPMAKTNCYLNSCKTPLIIRWPGHTKPGTLNERAMISSIDLTPTILEAAGLKQYTDIDGKSFARILEGEDIPHRELIFSQFYETSAKNAYPIKCVQDKNFGYIFNIWSDGKSVFKHEGQSGRTWQAILKAAESDKGLAEWVEFYKYRVKEELYDLKSDPDCMSNLINNPVYKKQADTKRRQLKEWMSSTNDTEDVKVEMK
jgi:N-sulfoglucosamine sulfohydrolase